MSNFAKKVLIDKGELDRLQQRQIRDFSPELQNMGELRSLMAELFEKKGLSDDAKLSLLKTYQARFDKLQKDTGLPTTGALSATSNGPEIVKKARAKSNSTEDAVDEEEAIETDDHEESETEDTPIDAKPAPLTIQQFGIQRMYEPKAKKLLLKITQHSDILTRNAAGEIVVHGKAEPGTNFDTLFKTMVTQKPNLNQHGIDKFLEALRSMGVRYNELSSKAVQAKYAPPPPSGSSKYQLATLKALPSSIAKVEPSVKYSTTKTSSSSSSGGKRKTEAVKDEQGGNGLKMYRPPGKRPNIIYLY
jgi:hypothetical protein